MKYIRLEHNTDIVDYIHYRPNEVKQIRTSNLISTNASIPQVPTFEDKPGYRTTAVLHYNRRLSQFFYTLEEEAMEVNE